MFNLTHHCIGKSKYISIFKVSYLKSLIVFQDLLKAKRKYPKTNIQARCD